MNQFSSNSFTKLIAFIITFQMTFFGIPVIPQSMAADEAMMQTADSAAKPTIPVDELETVQPEKELPNNDRDFFEPQTLSPSNEKSTDYRDSERNERGEVSLEYAMATAQEGSANIELIDLARINEKDISNLRNSSFEQGLFVIEDDGEFRAIYVTSGDLDMIRVHEKVAPYLDNQVFVLHNHPGGENVSKLDMLNAVDAPNWEAVGTSNGWQAYNKEGVLETAPNDTKIFETLISYTGKQAAGANQEVKQILNNLTSEWELLKDAQRAISDTKDGIKMRSAGFPGINETMSEDILTVKTTEIPPGGTCTTLPSTHTLSVTHDGRTVERLLGWFGDMQNQSTTECLNSDDPYTCQVKNYRIVLAGAEEMRPDYESETWNIQLELINGKYEVKKFDKTFTPKNGRERTHAYTFNNAGMPIYNPDKPTKYEIIGEIPLDEIITRYNNLVKDEIGNTPLLIKPPLRACQLNGSCGNIDFDEDINTAYANIQQLFIEMRDELREYGYVGSNNEHVPVEALDLIRYATTQLEAAYEYLNNYPGGVTIYNENGVYLTTANIPVLREKLEEVVPDWRHPPASLTDDILRREEWVPNEGSYPFRIFFDYHSSGLSYYVPTPSLRNSRDIILRFIEERKDTLIKNGQIDPDDFRKELLRPKYKYHWVSVGETPEGDPKFAIELFHENTALVHWRWQEADQEPMPATYDPETRKMTVNTSGTIFENQDWILTFQEDATGELHLTKFVRSLKEGLMEEEFFPTEADNLWGTDMTYYESRWAYSEETGQDELTQITKSYPEYRQITQHGIKEVDGEFRSVWLSRDISLRSYSELIGNEYFVPKARIKYTPTGIADDNQINYEEEIQIFDDWLGQNVVSTFNPGQVSAAGKTYNVGYGPIYRGHVPSANDRTFVGLGLYFENWKQLTSGKWVQDEIQVIDWPHQNRVVLNNQHFRIEIDNNDIRLTPVQPLAPFSMISSTEPHGHYRNLDISVDDKGVATVHFSLNFDYDNAELWTEDYGFDARVLDPMIGYYNDVTKKIHVQIDAIRELTIEVDASEISPRGNTRIKKVIDSDLLRTATYEYDHMVERWWLEGSPSTNRTYISLPSSRTYTEKKLSIFSKNEYTNREYFHFDSSGNMRTLIKIRESEKKDKESLLVEYTRLHAGKATHVYTSDLLVNPDPENQPNYPNQGQMEDINFIRDYNGEEIYKDVEFEDPETGETVLVRTRPLLDRIDEFATHMHVKHASDQGRGDDVYSIQYAKKVGEDNSNYKPRLLKYHPGWDVTPPNEWQGWVYNSYIFENNFELKVSSDESVSLDESDLNPEAGIGNSSLVNRSKILNLINHSSGITAINQTFNDAEGVTFLKGNGEYDYREPLKVEVNNKEYLVHYGRPEARDEFKDRANQHDFVYGMLFESGGQMIVVDYPNERTVTLDGNEYRIEIINGNVNLMNAMPTVEELYMEAREDIYGYFSEVPAMDPIMEAGIPLWDHLIKNSEVEGSVYKRVLDRLRQLRDDIDTTGWVSDDQGVESNGHPLGVELEYDAHERLIKLYGNVVSRKVQIETTNGDDEVIDISHIRDIFHNLQIDWNNPPAGLTPDVIKSEDWTITDRNYDLHIFRVEGPQPGYLNGPSDRNKRDIALRLIHKHEDFILVHGEFDEQRFKWAIQGYTNVDDVIQDFADAAETEIREMVENLSIPNLIDEGVLNSWLTSTFSRDDQVEDDSIYNRVEARLVQLKNEIASTRWDAQDPDAEFIVGNLWDHSEGRRVSSIASTLIRGKFNEMVDANVKVSLSDGSKAEMNSIEARNLLIDPAIMDVAGYWENPPAGLTPDILDEQSWSPWDNDFSFGVFYSGWAAMVAYMRAPSNRNLRDMALRLIHKHEDFIVVDGEIDMHRFSRAVQGDFELENDIPAIVIDNSPLQGIQDVIYDLETGNLHISNNGGNAFVLETNLFDPEGIDFTSSVRQLIEDGDGATFSHELTFYGEKDDDDVQLGEIVINQAETNSIEWAYKVVFTNHEGQIVMDFEKLTINRDYTFETANNLNDPINPAGPLTTPLTVIRDGVETKIYTIDLSAEINEIVLKENFLEERIHETFDNGEEVIKDSRNTRREVITRDSDNNITGWVQDQDHEIQVIDVDSNGEVLEIISSTRNKFSSVQGYKDGQNAQLQSAVESFVDGELVRHQVSRTVGYERPATQLVYELNHREGFEKNEVNIIRNGVLEETYPLGQAPVMTYAHDAYTGADLLDFFHFETNLHVGNFTFTDAAIISAVNDAPVIAHQIPNLSIEAGNVVLPEFPEGFPGDLIILDESTGDVLINTRKPFTDVDGDELFIEVAAEGDVELEPYHNEATDEYFLRIKIDENTLSNLSSLVSFTAYDRPVQDENGNPIEPLDPDMLVSETMSFNVNIVPSEEVTLPFGDGVLVMERISESTSKIRVMVGETTVEEFMVTDYEVIHNEVSGDYFHHEVLANTTDGVTVTFFHEGRKGDPADIDTHYTVVQNVASEIFGTLERIAQYDLVNDQMRINNEWLWHTFKFNGRDIREQRQRIYWVYDEQGDLVQENVIRTTMAAPGGPFYSSIAFKKVVAADGTLQLNNIQLYDPKLGWPVNREDLVTAANLVTEPESGLITYVEGKTSANQILKAHVNREHIDFVFNAKPIVASDTWYMQEDATSFSQVVWYTDVEDDVDKDVTLEFENINAPEGSIEMNSAGLVTFIPGRNFNGEVSFRYRAYDGIEHSDWATITIIIEPVNDAPVVEHPIADMLYAADHLGTVDLTHVFKDIDGETLSLEVSTNDPGLETSILYQANLDDSEAWSEARLIMQSASGYSNANGVTVIVTARDAEGLEVSESFVVTVLPVAGAVNDLFNVVGNYANWMHSGSVAKEDISVVSITSNELVLNLQGIEYAYKMNTNGEWQMTKASEAVVTAVRRLIASDVRINQIGVVSGPMLEGGLHRITMSQSTGTEVENHFDYRIDLTQSAIKDRIKIERVISRDANGSVTIELESPQHVRGVWLAMVAQDLIQQDKLSATEDHLLTMSGYIPVYGGSQGSYIEGFEIDLASKDTFFGYTGLFTLWSDAPSSVSLEWEHKADAIGESILLLSNMFYESYYKHIPIKDRNLMNVTQLPNNQLRINMYNLSFTFNANQYVSATSETAALVQVLKNLKDKEIIERYVPNTELYTQLDNQLVDISAGRVEITQDLGDFGEARYEYDVMLSTGEVNLVGLTMTQNNELIRVDLKGLGEEFSDFHHVKALAFVLNDHLRTYPDETTNELVLETMNKNGGDSQGTYYEVINLTLRSDWNQYDYNLLTTNRILYEYYQDGIVVTPIGEHGEYQAFARALSINLTSLPDFNKDGVVRPDDLIALSTAYEIMAGNNHLIGYLSDDVRMIIDKDGNGTITTQDAVMASAPIQNALLAISKAEDFASKLGFIPDINQDENVTIADLFMVGAGYESIISSGITPYLDDQIIKILDKDNDGIITLDGDAEIAAKPIQNILETLKEARAFVSKVQEADALSNELKQELQNMSNVTTKEINKIVTRYESQKSAPVIERAVITPKVFQNVTASNNLKPVIKVVNADKISGISNPIRLTNLNVQSYSINNTVSVERLSTFNIYELPQTMPIVLNTVKRFSAVKPVQPAVLPVAEMFGNAKVINPSLAAMADDSGESISGVSVEYDLSNAQKSGFSLKAGAGTTLRYDSALFEFFGQVEASEGSEDVESLTASIKFTDANGQMIDALIVLTSQVLAYEIDFAELNANFNHSEIVEIEVSVEASVEVDHTKAKLNLWMKGLAERLKAL